ncbi:MAG: biotin/lipoyl-containing protein [Negativicoccus massiliensis]|uniref:biotin/lipoyl-containing protein n=1 Tax=Negativicoccus succinicivorans TaxID=620903 RepID=UPI0026F08956|nr:biotin/lipoyl-containing protein [Negativicoccus succinicivorans]MBS5887900.1 biotin/lipoyl-binding protein [Negativicoccus succinicivorans]MDU4641447.1 biotin/lipoyl-containing protein [Negativicoccus massiliensis]
MRKFSVTVNGQEYDVEVNELGAGAAPKAAPAAAPAPAAKAAPAGAETVKAPMPGKILSVEVKEGQAVKAGDLLCVLEAMKMANEIYAPHDATVTSIMVAANATVQAGDDLIALG